MSCSIRPVGLGLDHVPCRDDVPALVELELRLGGLDGERAACEPRRFSARAGDLARERELLGDGLRVPARPGEDWSTSS